MATDAASQLVYSFSLTTTTTTTTAFGARGWTRAHRRSTICMGGEQRIKFKIFPDGRVEETVLGVKGEDCLKVTEEINEKLGKVISQENTAEMMEQPLNAENKVYESTKQQW